MPATEPGSRSTSPVREDDRASLPGTTTSVMQVAADALGLPARQVTFRLGDSAYPAAPPHAGATTMASVGSAAHTSCTALRNKFIGMAVADPASPLYRADPAKVAVREGRLRSGESGAADSCREILRRTGLPGVEATACDGRIVNAGLADYLVPVNAAVPELDAAFIDTEDPLADPIGVKGLGEITAVGVPAAIGNAVFNATGKRLTDLPIRLEALL
ncbi:molybdopterin cofactor-binding domain-containing protein [Streptomyces sp. NPDC048424]|uniref:molybdopterin cofactor-binding domain-containing protein n=1 Tax=Streptomyces sp. NPDC048424 TaxID=3155265 RepID=UPI0034383E9F